MLILIITFIIIIFIITITKKSINEREKMSPFECGVDPINSSRLPFSIRFFLISLVFLVFDVEIVLILPSILIFKNSNTENWFTLISFFTLILILGLIHEWKQGALEWAR